jgi:hypothetical protein
VRHGELGAYLFCVTLVVTLLEPLDDPCGTFLPVVELKPAPPPPLPVMLLLEEERTIIVLPLEEVEERDGSSK